MAMQSVLDSVSNQFVVCDAIQGCQACLPIHLRVTKAERFVLIACYACVTSFKELLCKEMGNNSKMKRGKNFFVASDGHAII